jgi:hypothetical protein
MKIRLRTNHQSNYFKECYGILRILYKIYIDFDKAAECETLSEIQNLVSAYLRLMILNKLKLAIITIETPTKTFNITETVNQEAFDKYREQLFEQDMKLMENDKKTYIDSQHSA